MNTITFASILSGNVSLNPGTKNTAKTLNSGNLQVLKILSVIKRCPLLGGSSTKIVTYGTKHFVRYSRHVRYLGCPLLGGFFVTPSHRI